MTVGTKRGTQTSSVCGGGTPTRMRSNAVGGGTRTLCLAWEVAIMMPLQTYINERTSTVHKISCVAKLLQLSFTVFTCLSCFLTGGVADSERK